MVAAGSIRTPAQAERALDSGLSLVAIGQGLVMNPAWVELVRNERQDEIAQCIAASDVERLAVPAKLWAVIEAAPGWFKVQEAA